MELMMRDTKALIAERRSDREMREAYPCGTATGMVLAVLHVIISVPLLILWYFLKLAWKHRPKKVGGGAPGARRGSRRLGARRGEPSPRRASNGPQPGLF